MTNYYYIPLILFTLLYTSISCKNNKDSTDIKIPISNETKKAKFEPNDGECYVFIGQDLGAIGGLQGYNNGYCDFFQVPAGVTAYLGMSNDDTANIGGLYEIDNWGSGDCCADLYTKSSNFDKCMIAIGFPIVGQEVDIINGKYDNKLETLGQWIKNISPRPIFLRIGYEFDGSDWNHYVPETYIPAYKYIKNFFDNMNIKNVAYVWQSKGYGTSVSSLQEWYPGDEYVDWCAYSHFGEPDKAMIDFARRKGKPVFIAEATPILQDGNIYLDSDIKKPEVAERMANQWFNNFFKTIEENNDVIKAFSYINVDWLSQPMWIENITFQKCDSRIQESEYITNLWKDKLSNTSYINSINVKWNN